MGEQDAVVGLDPSVADDNMDTKAGDETETARDESEGMEEQDAQEEVQSKQVRKMSPGP